MARERLIVSNTTPIINFAEIGRLDLLEGLFGKVVAPPAVIAELLAKKDLFPAAAAAAVRLEVIEPADRLLVRRFASSAHPGEAECLALGMEHEGALLLLDDLQARTLAAGNGLRFTGTLGCLAEAKARGLVGSLAPLIEELRVCARFWISRDLEVRVLNDVGEFRD